MQYLYCVESAAADAPTWEAFLELTESTGADTAYARRLVEGVRDGLSGLDASIASAAQNWEIDRISAVDRNILRLGAWELREGSEVPPSVAIDEAVELAKDFGDKAAGSFVNGVLDTIRRVGG